MKCGLKWGLSAALLANALDAATTWVGVAWFHEREVGILGGVMVTAWGLVPALVVLKGGAALLILGIAVIATEGERRWWRAKPNQRWLPILGLWVLTFWYASPAFHNAVGMWRIPRGIPSK
jgi:uncharacterized membrane protein